MESWSRNAIIIDVDWAPEEVIQETAELLISHNVKSTWFVTHPTQSQKLLEQRSDLFEIGIHPNFLPGSTQGAGHEEVIDYCLKLVPEARIMRTHAYYQSSSMYAYIAEKTAIEIDVSVFMPHTAYLRPYRYWIGGRYIIRVPVFWEDDNEMKNPDRNMDLSTVDLSNSGLKVFAFHPIHVCLNSTDFSNYLNLKNSIKDIQNASYTQIKSFMQKNGRQGVKDFLLQLLETIKSQGSFLTIGEIITIQQGR